eukprot:GHVH01000517.1.p1 GENE.GHVH01000517.1~~GHVH01000517.1.p1  ORF type:complete len:158 (+),score=15.61 GHVH01000517.1:17-490(+)
MKVQEKGGVNFSVNRCSVCKQRETNERHVLHSSFCGHRVCLPCLREKKRVADRGTELVQLGIVESLATNEIIGEENITCTVCEQSFPRSFWVNLIHEQQTFIRYRRFRDRVLAVMNSNRDRFASTPDYDTYIEMREEKINHICKAPSLPRLWSGSVS